MNATPSRRLAVIGSFLIVALLLQPQSGGAQDATPPAGDDPCLAAAGTSTPWPMWPDMMTPGAMGPGMMIGDPELMTLDMLRYHAMVDTTIAQVAIARAEQAELRTLAEQVLRARQAEADQLNQWRQQWYPGQPELPMGPMMGPMMGMMMGPMMGSMMQGTPWPGMPGMLDISQMMPIMGMMGMGPNSVVAALCTASPADPAIVDAMLVSAQMTQVMPQMMGQWVTRPELRQFVQDAAATRQAELEQLLQVQGSLPATDGTPAAAASGAGATVEAYDIYFEPRELTISAGTDVILTLPNEGVTLHNFSIDVLGISVDIPAGATETVTINAPAGSYEYYCNVPGHKPAGMVGTLIVQ
jgi:uncharacterized cupredoxin-like copper-binding protein